MKLFTIIISVCSIEAANNVKSIIVNEAITYAVKNKRSLFSSVEMQKTKDGADLKLCSDDGNFLFSTGIELGMKMHTICPHNEKCKQYEFHSN